MKASCMTRDSTGEEVTAHCHYLDICYAYPDTDGWPMIHGRRLTEPLLRWFRNGRRAPVTDPHEEPRPPCPVCETPVDVDWLEVTGLGHAQAQWIPGQVRCPKTRFHDTGLAAGELRWPNELTDEDRVWLREHLTLTAEEGT